MNERGPIQLTPGLPLPAVTLPATDGSHICLATLPGRSIVAVYPWTGRDGIPNPPGWDDIPGAHGSTPELEGFREMFELISHAGARLFAVSGQSTAFQREMALRLELPFPILSDAGGALRHALHLPTFEAGSETYLKRLTFVVLDGQVEHVFFPVADPEAHAAEIVDWLKSRG
ncbi:peroxiredoxin [Methyloceanibacter caenitepidi]|uniref:Alkyl hydroperoxide reductase subunit C-like protein n=1 Tax=Methyloceanibacter caenitepidi TaxID=1384459 RepID=A0A0A8K4F4_9HYPH|nr:peroxiredoxin [Methyloceanibacter caenitepidi]BAQ17392.1 alkyl hydroperoxide reductase subunit C-like protein [Methyloceanibacter caenitepidi]